MTKDEFGGDRRRVQEEEYFRKKDQELIEKQQQRKRDLATLRQIAERAGVADDDLLRDLQELGYTPETVSIIPLVPLLQMAWAEGSVSERERDLIIEAARARGVEKDSAADRQLAAWLANRPSDALFETTLRAISAVLQAQSAEERDATQRDLCLSSDGHRLRLGRHPGLRQGVPPGTAGARSCQSGNRARTRWPGTSRFLEGRRPVAERARRRVVRAASHALAWTSQA